MPVIFWIQTEMMSSTIFFIIISKRIIIKDHKVNKSMFIDEKIGLLLRKVYNSVCSNSRSSIIMHIPQELRIRSGGTERHSASSWAKLSRLISYYWLLCDPCLEIQGDMPWMSFGLDRHRRRWNPQKADTIRILESVR